MNEHLTKSYSTGIRSRLPLLLSAVLCVTLPALAFAHGQPNPPRAPENIERASGAPEVAATPNQNPQGTPLPTALARGILEEEGNLNLRAAMKNYQAVIAQFDEQRRYVATALFRLGECYRKLGQTNEATAQYQRIVREFPDQQSLVMLSQQNLKGLRIPGTAPGEAVARSGTAATGSASDEANLLAAHLSGLDQLKDDPEQRARAVLALFPDDDLKQMLLNLPRLREQEAKLRANPKMDMAHDGFRVAAGPLAELHVGGASPGLPEAEAELRKQLALIEQRVDFIVGIQKARLQVLEAGAGSSMARETAKNAGPRTAAAPNEQDEELRRIQALQQNSPDLINAVGKDNETLLQAAAGKGQLEVVRFLLDHGAAVNGLKQPELTPLHYAAGNGRLAVAELLLQRGARVDAVTASGVTPLHLAVLKGYEHVAKALLDAGAPVNVVTHVADRANGAGVSYDFSSGASPLDVAITSGYSSLVELLLDRGADVNARRDSGGTPLHLAAGRGQTAAVELLIRHGASLNAKDSAGDTPLHLAAAGGHLGVLKALVEAKPNLNARNNAGETPLLVAAKNRKHEAAEALLAAGADPNLATPVSGKGVTPLLWAVAAQDEVLTRDLLERGADPNSIGRYRPMYGAMGLTFGEPGTSLEMACDMGNVALAKLLLDHGANPNIRLATSGFPLLASLSVFNKPELLNLLLEHKADPNLADAEGETPLHFVARQGSTNSLALLVEHGANVNARTTSGATPLHYAVEQNRLDMIEALLAAKADPNLADNQGRTPLDMAKAQQGMIGPGAAILRAMGARYPNIPPQLPSIAQPPPPAPAAPPKYAAPAEIAATLRRAGALEDIPHLDQIQVSRRSAQYSQVIFRKGTNDWNRFTLLDLIADCYGLISTSQEWRINGKEYLQVFTKRYSHPYDQYPDFARIVIRRPTKDGSQWTEQPIDLSDTFHSTNCVGDVPLQWGDVVDIPEADHPVNENWPGLSASVLGTLEKCLTRHLEVSVKGQTNPMALSPDISCTLQNQPEIVSPEVPFMLRPALLRSNLVLASSDLSRVKVSRVDPTTGQTREWVLNCSDAQTAPDFWLRDGDHIDIPEK